MNTITPPRPNAGNPKTDALLNKVPQVILLFWVIKILATTVGETAADYLNFDLNFGLTATTLVMTGALALALFIQVQAPRYIPWRYWLTVVLVSVVGTLITDNLTDHLGIPLEVSTAGFAGALILVFALWYQREGTLSIHHVDTRARELFYWLAILCTFALGTAAGDLLAERLNAGFLNATLIFASSIGLIYLAYRFFKLGPILAFWLAYILTRPLGASFGDYLSQPVADGGLGLGTVGTSALFLSVILALVIYLTATHKDRLPD